MTSALSFHCIICIEAFDQRDHYPVVLPCGHTYVCNQCAERLTKCMECRESLFAPNDPTTIPYRPENQITNNNDPNSRYSNRSASVRSLPSNVRPSVFSLRNKRLPLPKNIVLLSLIDATSVLSSSTQHQSNHTSQIEDYESSSDIQVSLSYDEKENEDQEERLQIGTWLAASGCGTYVITNIQGVQVYPTIELHQDSNDDDDDDDDITTKSLDFASRSQDITCDETSGMFQSSDDHKPIYLRKGDRVQVVYIENGWAKLARDYGFIPIGDKNIVRVGESMDQSCTLEAILRYTEMEKNELNHRLTKVSNRFSQVTNELQRTYDYCDDLTIVTADTSIPQDEIKVTFLDDSNERDSHKLKSASTGSGDISYQTPRTANVFSIPANSTQSTFSCITESLFTNFGVSSEITDDAISVGNPRSELFSGIMRAFSITESTSVAQAHNRDILRAVSYPSPRSVLDSSLRDQRLRPGSRVSVDFRTGMSGHLALLSTQRNKTLAKSYPSMLGKMSSHTGLTLTTRKSLTPRIPKIGE